MVKIVLALLAMRITRTEKADRSNTFRQKQSTEELCDAWINWVDLEIIRVISNSTLLIIAYRILFY